MTTDPGQLGEPPQPADTVSPPGRGGGSRRRELGAAGLVFVAALGLAAYNAPLTPETVMAGPERTGPLAETRDVHAMAHGRAFYRCAGFSERRAAALEKLLAEARSMPSDAFEPTATWRFLRQANESLVAVYAEGCPNGWEPYDQINRYQGVVPDAYPHLIALTRLGLAEPTLQALIIVMGWLGSATACLLVYLLCFQLLRRRRDAAGLALAGLLASAGFAYALAAAAATPRWGGGVAAFARWLQSCAWPFVSVAILAWCSGARATGSRPARWLLGVLSVAAFALHAGLYYLFDPPPARALLAPAVLLLLLVAARRRRPDAVLRLAGCALALAALGWAQARESRSVFPIASVDHFASEAYVIDMFALGWFERPTRHGLFYMDEVLYWIPLADPLLGDVVPAVTVHQSFPWWGRRLVADAVDTAGLESPLLLADLVARRLVAQLLFQGDYFGAEGPRFTAVFVLLLALSACGVLALLRGGAQLERSRDLFALSWLFAWGNIFAVNTTLALFHGHARWSEVGLAILLVCAGPSLLATPRLLQPAVRGLRVVLSSAGGGRRRALGVAGTIAAALVLLLLGGRHLSRLARSEALYNEIRWTALSPDDFSDFTLDYIERQVAAVREVEPQQPGAAEMWGMGMLLLFESRGYATLDGVRPGRLRRMRSLRERYFAEAIGASPDNPHYRFAARLLRVADWEAHARAGLEIQADHPWAGIMALRLHRLGTCEGPECARLARLYEARVDATLAATSSWRPGFVAAPEHVRLPNGAPSREEWLELEAGETAQFERVPSFGARQVRLAVYLELERGRVEAGIDGCAPTLLASDPREIRYRWLSCELHAGTRDFALKLRGRGRGARLRVRNYYPVVKHPLGEPRL